MAAYEPENILPLLEPVVIFSASSVVFLVGSPWKRVASPWNFPPWNFPT